MSAFCDELIFRLSKNLGIMSIFRPVGQPWFEQLGADNPAIVYLGSSLDPISISSTARAA